MAPIAHDSCRLQACSLEHNVIHEGRERSEYISGNSQFRPLRAANRDPFGVALDAHLQGRNWPGCHDDLPDKHECTSPLASTSKGKKVRQRHDSLVRRLKLVFNRAGANVRMANHEELGWFICAITSGGQTSSPISFQGHKCGTPFFTA